MLQPVELQEVSGRFAGEIGLLRRFLSQAAVPLDSAASAHRLAARLAQDSSFHRDLSSHLWVLLDESDTALRSADLLGIVMIALTGVREAAATNEEDAHALLRFLMETKHSFEGTVSRSHEAGPSAARQSRSDETLALTGSGCAFSPEDRRVMPHRSAERPAAQVQPPVPSRSEPNEPRRKGMYAAGIAAAVVLVFVLLALWHRGKTTEQGDVASVSDATSNGQGSVGNSPVMDRTAPAKRSEGRSTLRREFDRLRAATTLHSAPPAASSLQPARSGGTSSAPASAARENGGEVNASAPAYVPSTRSSAADFVPPGAVATSPVMVSPRSPAMTGAAVRPPAMGAPIPAETLTRQLDSPRLPAYASDIEDSSRRKYPRLLRRHAGDATNASGGTDPVLTAEMRAPDLAGTSRGAGASSIRGEVRSTCLGMMASNLIYGPSPQYPAVAASARVQGEVKIQATVDRDGTINSARVISGPPPLRDAALDAVQRWRFKPFLSAGKATPTAAMAVVEFELQ